MIIRRAWMNKLIILLGTVLIGIIFFITVKAILSTQELKAYNKAGGEIVVIFGKEPDEKDLLQLFAKYSEKATIVRHIGDYALLSVKEPSVFQEMIKKLASEPGVFSARANAAVKILSTEDSFSDTQWYLDNPGYYISMEGSNKTDKESVEDIDMDVPQAWSDMAESGADREVVVAVIDTGVDYKHPDLAENMWVNEGEIPGDNIDNDNNGYVDDIYGWDFYNDDATVCHYNRSGRALASDNDNHGTHVAGIIAAQADNNIGIAGVASHINVKIMSLKMTGGKDGEGRISDAIEAIKYATMMGADICNLSWGEDLYDPGLEEIMRESDVLFVAAAGNTGDDNDEKPVYPASYKLDNLISVTFVDAYGELTIDSNYGKNSVDIAAPGDDIFSTVVGSYASLSGSSMAVPQVSAVAAMLYAYHDHLYASNVKDIIIGNLKAINGLKDYIANGGIPSADKAVLASGNLIPDVDPPVMSPSAIFNKDTMTIPVNVKDIGPSGIRVIKWIFGEKDLSDFQNGVNGTTILNNQVDLSKAGMYTFYASDYAGNEMSMTYEVKEDKTKPKLSAAFSVSDNYKYRTVTIKVSDGQSGVKRVKYMKGSKLPEDFLPAGVGTEVTIKDNKGTFKVKEDGTYTIFAIDNRGNISMKKLGIKTIKSTQFNLLTIKKTMYIADNYILVSKITPAESTDKITYTSSNEKVAVVSATGTVTALSEGETTITARTSSGLSSTCRITVIKLE